MSRSAARDAIVIVLDVGKSVSQLYEGDEITFFENSKRCASMILQSKVLSESKVDIGLLLMGADCANNRTVISGFDNVTCKFELGPVNWDMLKTLENEVQTTDKSSDWIDALVVAIQMLKDYSEFNKIANKKVIFFTDFSHPVSDDSVSTIIKNLKSMDIDIIVIGPNVVLKILNDKETGEPVTKKIKHDQTNGTKIKSNRPKAVVEGEKLISKVKHELGDKMKICNFEIALQQILTNTRKEVRCTPWYTILEVGDIKIRISAFKKTDTKRSLPSFKLKSYKEQDGSNGGDGDRAAQPAREPRTEPAVRDKIMHYKHVDPNTKEVEEVTVTADEVIEGYRYGATIVPFTAEDKAALTYQPGPRTLSIIGFASSSSIPPYLLSGDSCYYVVPRDQDEHAEAALSAFIQAMNSQGTVAIARRVYNNNMGLSVGALYPVIEKYEDDECGEDFYKECLLFVQLAFDQEVRSLDFPSLDDEAKLLSDEKIAAVDSLIDEMDLMEAEADLNGEPCEAFDFTSLKDFKNQFYQFCVVQKILFPNKPVPKNIPDYINNFCSLPKSLEFKQKECVKRLNKNFELKLVKDTKTETVENVLKQKSEVDNAEASTSHANRQYNFTPEDVINDDVTFPEELEGDFNKLFHKSKLPNNTEIDMLIQYYVEDIQTQMTEVCEVIIKCVKKLRQKCVETQLEEYNQWVTKCKAWLLEKIRHGRTIWDSIVAENLGLITEKENNKSTVTEQEAGNFLDSPLTQSLPVQTPRNPRPTFATLPATNEAEGEEAFNCLFD